MASHFKILRMIFPVGDDRDIDAIATGAAAPAGDSVPRD
jgi:hypothetical protein